MSEVDLSSPVVHINGLTLQEIERRARPLEDKFDDPGSYRFRSSKGFLGSEETFLERLKEDDALVKSLNTSHQALASHLMSLLALVEERRRELKAGPSRPIEVEFCAKEFSLEPQRYRVTKKLYAGAQSSLFFNPANPDIENLLRNLKETWNDEYVIENEESRVELLVGGNERHGVLQYILRYGFYQGGLLNPYRIDPVRIAALLQGKITPELLRLNRITLEKKVQFTESTLERLTMLKETSSTKEDDSFIDREVQRLKEELEALRIKKTESQSEPAPNPSCSIS